MELSHLVAFPEVRAGGSSGAVTGFGAGLVVDRLGVCLTGGEDPPDVVAGCRSLVRTGPPGAQQGVAQLERRVAPGGQTRVQLRPEVRDFRERIPQESLMFQTHDHGLRADPLCDGAQDQMEAVLTFG
jgi:hypothetical protein